MSKVKRHWWIGLLVLTGAAAVAVWTGNGLMSRGNPTPMAATPTAEGVAVATEPATARPMRRSLAVVGSLYGRDEVAIAPKVEGRVLRVHHDVGDRVRPGELLIELDPVDYQLAANDARRSLELELAKLGLKELPAGSLDVKALPSVVRAAVMEKNANTRADRMRRLSGTVSPEDREQAETDGEVAKANMRQAVIDAEATLAAARQKQAALESALQKLKDTRLLAPIPKDEPSIGRPLEYVVCQRSASEGEMVWAMPAFPGANTTVIKLAIDRPLKLQATVPERHRGEVTVGQKAELEVEAYPGLRFPGQVSRIGPSVDRANRTFTVEILVPNEDLRLAPGCFAKADIFTRVDPAAVTVPEEAVVRFAGVTKVFVVRAGKACAVPVQTGAAVVMTGADGGSRTWLEVEGKIAVGDAVVTAGQSQLAEGTAVRTPSEANIAQGGRP
jgi:RND family efflux transporter MFP subunit